MRRRQVLKDARMTLVSGVVFMCLPDRILVYGVCNINVDAGPQQLAYIAVISAETTAILVVMLSCSTLESESGPQMEQ